MSATDGASLSQPSPDRAAVPSPRRVSQSAAARTSPPALGGPTTAVEVATVGSRLDNGEPPAALAADLAAQWMLDPAVDFLNHGSFGALPRAVARAQDAKRAFIEARPIERLGRGCTELLAPAKAALANFVGAAPAEIGFVVNATEGANAVLRSLDLRPGDELLTSDHVYNALRKTMIYVARRAGATYIEVPLPPPLDDEEQIAARVVERITPRTRLVVIDHISSPTAIRFPVERIVQAAKERGVPTLVDGAHAPGMVPLDLEAIGAAYYVGNLHKWVCAPKGCAFLHARLEVQRDLHPATVSHFLDEGFGREFDWQGTRDITPWLCAPVALAFMDDAAIGLGWNRVRSHNHQLARWVQSLLCRRWNVEPLSPLDGSRIGSMATVRLPESLQPGAGARYSTFGELQLAICSRHSIEVPVVEWNGVRHVRPCCQVYNRPEQYERLADAIEALAREAA